MSKIYEVTQNLLNIRYNESNKWKGQTGSYKGFCVFENTDYSIRAGIKILRSYNKRGIKNIRDIIKAFAPPSENDTERYIKSVCRWTGYTPEMELTSPVIASMVISAMIRMETGLQLSASHVYEIIINTK